MKPEIWGSPDSDQAGGAANEGRILDYDKLTRDAKDWLSDLMRAMKHNLWYKTGGFPEEKHPEFVGYYIDHNDHRVYPVYRTTDGVFASIHYHPVAQRSIHFSVGMGVVYLPPAQ